MSPLKKRRNSYLLRTYGISLDQYDDLLKSQKFRCAICLKHKSEEKKALHVDHDHKTGEIRGILCNFCNHRLIGRHRDPELFISAGHYLAGPFTGWIVPPKKKRKRRRK